MIRWEYCRLTWFVRKITPLLRAEFEEAGVEADFVELDGETLMIKGSLHHLGHTEVQRISNLGETIARLGREGWDMVSHIQVSHPAEMESFYFKRALRE